MTRRLIAAAVALGCGALAAVPWRVSAAASPVTLDDDVVSDGLSLYSRDGQGRFSRKASYDGNAWKIADLNEMLLTTAGHEVFDFMLQPKAGTPTAWTLNLAFTRGPEPVRR